MKTSNVVQLVPVSGTKLCRTCGVVKNIIEFHVRRDAKIGTVPKCKTCSREYSRKYRKIRYANNPDYDRNLHLKRTFGITIEDYNKLFIEQGGNCKVCGIHQIELNKKLAVDHCHRTGIIRGLLCHSCNVTLGHVKDSIFILKNMIDYLEG